jgi:hypothetical protein
LMRPLVRREDTANVICVGRVLGRDNATPGLGNECDGCIR